LVTVLYRGNRARFDLSPGFFSSCFAKLALNFEQKDKKALILPLNTPISRVQIQKLGQGSISTERRHQLWVSDAHNYTSRFFSSISGKRLKEW
jgi:hypothetical protein